MTVNFFGRRFVLRFELRLNVSSRFPVFLSACKKEEEGAVSKRRPDGRDGKGMSEKQRWRLVRQKDLPFRPDIVPEEVLEGPSGGKCLCVLGSP